jgi:hypothetical protein
MFRRRFLMVTDWLSYATSPLNPFLKGVVLFLFLGAACCFYRSRSKYGGILQSISTFLLVGAVAGILSAWFRLNGDLYAQYKWGESLFNIVLAFLILAIALMIRKKLYDAIEVFREGKT